MSFVGKAIKKVFKVVKKIVKSKWFKIALIVAACVFTAGIAAGGFTMVAGSGIGGFFSAVGTTMSAGISSIAGGLGFASTAGTGTAMVGTTANTVGVLAAGEGAAASLGGTAGLLAGGATSIAEAAGAAAGLGSIAAPALTGAAALTPLAANVVTTPATTSFLGKLGGLLVDKGAAGTAMRQGIMGGISMWSANNEAKQADKYKRSSYVWGNSAFDGDGTGLAMPTLKSGGEGGTDMFKDQGMMAQAPDQAALPESNQPMASQLLTPQQSTNNQMAQQSRPLSAEQSSAVAQQPAPAPNALFTPQNLGVV